jgi:ribose transport system permease protein
MPDKTTTDDGNVPSPRGGSTSVDPPGKTHRAQAKTRRGPVGTVVHLLQHYSLLALLLASLVFYGTWSETSAVFNQAANFQNIAGSQSVLAVLTLGLLIPMVSGNLDLSIGSTAGLSSIAAAGLYADAGAPLIVGILFGIGVGALVGLVNGLVVTRFNIDSFIVTLGTASLILGIVNWYSEGNSIVQGIPQSVISFGGGLTFGIPNLVFVLAAVAFGVWYLLEQTPYGRNLHAIGSNKAASRLVGIRVERDTCLAFVLSGTFAGLAGVLLLARSGAGNPQVGQTFTLTAIAAAFLGAASFKLGKFNVLGSLVAIFFLAVNITGLQFAGVANWISDVFTGLALVLAVAFAGIMSRPRKAAKPKPAAAAEAEAPDAVPRR